MRLCMVFLDIGVAAGDLHPDTNIEFIANLQIDVFHAFQANWAIGGLDDDEFINGTISAMAALLVGVSTEQGRKRFASQLPLLSDTASG